MNDTMKSHSTEWPVNRDGTANTGLKPREGQLRFPSVPHVVNQLHQSPMISRQNQRRMGLHQWKMPARMDWHFSFFLRSALRGLLSFVGTHVNIGADDPWRARDVKGHGA